MNRLHTTHTSYYLRPFDYLVPNKALMPSMKGYPMDWVASTLPFFHREEFHISAVAETTSW